MQQRRKRIRQRRQVSVLFSEPKIPQSRKRTFSTASFSVSVLFSEPKIPQFQWDGGIVVFLVSFSALQRAENSSIKCNFAPVPHVPAVSVLFSEPKIPQSRVCSQTKYVQKCFSALQRAENSSIVLERVAQNVRGVFQCSSASRKFLNVRPARYSARRRRVSVLFSEPKIPQWFRRAGRARNPEVFQCSSASRKFLNFLGSLVVEIDEDVSVLFSEPKIPQFRTLPRSSRGAEFQCSSASRKFLNAARLREEVAAAVSFSALQRAENSSIVAGSGAPVARETVSVLFSEPKIPQFWLNHAQPVKTASFQCSSASRKFLNG